MKHKKRIHHMGVHHQGHHSNHPHPGHAAVHGHFHQGAPVKSKGKRLPGLNKGY